jgi:hypothetical protein
VVGAAAGAGVALLALTDHDTVEGVPEAIAAAGAAGIRVVPAVEISARDRELRKDLHILGYLIDTADAPLLELLDRSRNDRLRRSDAMVEALKGLGFKLDTALLDARRAAGESIGRPHIAQAVVAAPENATRLAVEGLGDPSAVLEAYLVPGAPAFRPRYSPSTQEAIAAITGAGGIAVWAHPFFDVTAPDEVIAEIERLAAAGLGGVECFYPTHSQTQTEMLADACDARGLLSTGSTDFHGPEHTMLNRFRGFSTYGREPALGRIAEA